MHVRDAQFSLTNYHLMEFGEPLLALVALELRPELEVLINKLQGLLVILWKLDLLPELVGQVCPLNSLHV